MKVALILIYSISIRILINNFIKSIYCFENNLPFFINLNEKILLASKIIAIHLPIYLSEGEILIISDGVNCNNING